MTRFNILNAPKQLSRSYPVWNEFDGGANGQEGVCLFDIENFMAQTMIRPTLNIHERWDQVYEYSEPSHIRPGAQHGRKAGGTTIDGKNRPFYKQWQLRPGAKAATIPFDSIPPKNYAGNKPVTPFDDKVEWSPYFKHFYEDSQYVDPKRPLHYPWLSEAPDKTLYTMRNKVVNGGNTKDESSAYTQHDFMKGKKFWGWEDYFSMTTEANKKNDDVLSVNQLGDGMLTWEFMRHLVNNHHCYRCPQKMYYDGQASGALLQSGQGGQWQCNRRYLTADGKMDQVKYFNDWGVRAEGSELDFHGTGTGKFNKRENFCHIEMSSNLFKQ